MKASLVFRKIKTSLKNILKILIKPPYFLLAIVAGLIILGVILWSLNLDLLSYVFIESGLPLNEKISFFISVYKGIFVSSGQLPALTMIILSILFGINISSMVFVIKNRKHQKTKYGSTAAGLSLAIIGGGCVACGTSVLTPLLLTLGVGGAVSYLSEIGVYINLLASCFLLWSIYKLGLNAGTIFAHIKNK